MSMVDAFNFLASARGFIFDVDGTIMDSHEGHYHAWDRTARAHGFEYTQEEIVQHFGKTTQQIAIELLHLTEAGDIDAVSHEKDGNFLEEIPALELFPGTREVFERLKSKGVLLCLASSNHNAVLERIIAAFDLGFFVDAYVGLSDITRGKPDPEMILLSAARLELDPSECVMVGDTVYDIQAGQRAGCGGTIGVLTGSFSREQLAGEEPTLILDHVGQLLEYL